MQVHRLFKLCASNKTHMLSSSYITEKSSLTFFFFLTENKIYMYGIYLKEEKRQQSEKNSITIVMI